MRKAGLARRTSPATRTGAGRVARWLEFSVVSETVDFTEATDRLTKGINLADLARELDASYGLIRQARMDPASPSYRRPPAGWEEAVARLAGERAKELLTLKSHLEYRP